MSKKYTEEFVKDINDKQLKYTLADVMRNNKNVDYDEHELIRLEKQFWGI